MTKLDDKKAPEKLESNQGFKYTKEYFERRRNQMKEVFYNIKADLEELADYFSPNSVKFLITDVNKKRKKASKILDSTPLVAVRNFSSGMMSGATSPTRRWFKTVLMNKEIEAGNWEIKNWCAKQAELTRKILYSSNFYQLLPSVYKQLGIFSFSALAILKDYDSVVKFKLLPIGSYYYSKNYKDKTDTFCRNFCMSAKDLISEFGIENVSDTVKEASLKNHDKMFEVVHFVEPNKNYIKDSKIKYQKEFISCYYETGSDSLLRLSGFKKFPFVVFESGCNGEDNYPTDGIGYNALPDVKQLMTMVKEYAKAVKKMVSPSIKGPASLKGKNIADTPGHYNETDENGQGISPVYEVNPRVLELKQEKDELKQTIKEHFYNDLFAMILNTAERSRTATEVNELKEEKMVLLSPLLEQIHSALRIILDWIFYEESDTGILPEVPKILEGQEIEVEFVSTLAQALKAQNIASMERFTTFVANIGNSIDPILLKKLRGEKIIDDYADFANIDPSQVLPTEELNEIRRTIEEKQQQQEAIAQLQAGGQFVKNMGGVDAIGQGLMARIGN